MRVDGVRKLVQLHEERKAKERCQEENAGPVSTLLPT